MILKQQCINLDLNFFIHKIFNKFNSGRILWDLAGEKVKEKEETNDDLLEEKNVIFVGSHDSVNF